MPKLVMPERKPDDGPITVSLLGPNYDRVAISAEGPQGSSGLVISEYNAWRLFGMLSMILHIPLTKEAGKAIKL